MWKDILKAFVDSWKEKSEVEGILLHSDRATGYFDEDTDINILILVNNMENFESGSILEVIEGYKFVYNVYSFDGIKDQLAIDYRKFNQTTAIDILVGKILYDANGNLTLLKDIALEYRNKSFPALLNISKIKNDIEFIGRELLKKFDYEDFEFQYFLAVDKIVQYYLNYIGVAYYPNKLFRLFADQDYAKEYLYPQLEDKIFMNFVVRAIIAKEKEEKLTVIQNLIKHILFEMK